MTTFVDPLTALDRVMLRCIEQVGVTGDADDMLTF